MTYLPGSNFFFFHDLVCMYMYIYMYNVDVRLLFDRNRDVLFRDESVGCAEMD